MATSKASKKTSSKTSKKASSKRAGRKKTNKTLPEQPKLPERIPMEVPGPSAPLLPGKKQPVAEPPDPEGTPSNTMPEDVARLHNQAPK